MRRSPFYDHPSSAPGFHRPHHNFFSDHYPPSAPQSPSTRPQPRCVITIPVHDHHSVSPPSSSSHHPSKFTPLSATERRTVDLDVAATRIQSHFRGFSIRRRHPLLHLRTICIAHKQLETLKAELQSPGFARNVKTNEKERLRFNEAVMAAILRLDAIEGPIPEVRLRRKEATKMAIKLQDAVDALVMQEEREGSDVKQLDGTGSNADRVVEENNPVDREQSDLSSGSSFTEATQKEGAARNFNGDASEDVDHVPADCFFTNDCGTREECHHRVDPLSNVANVEHNVSKTAPTHMSGSDCSNRVDLAYSSDEPVLECVLPVRVCAADKLRNTAEKGSTCEEEEEGDIADLSPVEGVMNGVSISIEEDVEVDNAVIENDMNGARTTATLEQENEARCTQCEEECVGLLSGAGELGRIQENIGILEGQKEAEEEPMESLMSTEVRVGEGHESAGLQSSDRMLLQQLPEDCKHLKSMLRKLLVQSRAQSKVICALADRLETLEHQQQMICPQQQHRRKPKKGLKKC